MKIIFLNCWEGKMEDALRSFLLEHRETADIFCFQEARAEFEVLAEEIFADYEKRSVYKAASSEKYGFANSTYIRKGLTFGETETLLPESDNCGVGLYSEIVTGDTHFALVNFHGIAKPGTKLDTSERLHQARTIIEFMKKKKMPHIIGGDFNMLPDTESMRMFEKAGYQDLIRDFAIETTRNEVSWSMYPNNQKQLYADFAFVSRDVQVANFTVPQNEISDHLPLILGVVI